MPPGRAYLPNNRERVSTLYDAHRDEIYRFLVAQGLIPAVAQEVTQDVFVDLFVALEKGTQMNSERAWLYAVAGRAAKILHVSTSTVAEWLLWAVDRLRDEADG